MRRQSIGSFTVDRVVESEGPFTTLDYLLPDAPPELIAEHGDWLKPVFIDAATDQVVMSFHAFVLKSRRFTILVDGCIGNDKERPLRPHWHRKKFPFLERLAAIGVQPEAIDFVLCTHLHADHVGWNTRLQDGRWVPTFPNARYVFARREYQYWEREHRRAVAAATELPNHGSFGDSVLPIVEAGRAQLVEDDHSLDDGVWLEGAAGHTPGTVMLNVTDAGHRAVFLGDIMHSGAQLSDPSLSSRFCADPDRSARTRLRLCERFAGTDTTIFTGHFPTPTAGRIVRHKQAFRFAM